MEGRAGNRTIVFAGNFSVPYSTESHLAASLEALGHHVVRIQEGDTRATDIAAFCNGADIFLHVQTRGLAITGGTDEEREQMYRDIKALDVPIVGYHLDLFFGLDREDYVASDPYFRNCDYFFSTDGGHDDRWAELGINHHYLPPGVFHEEAYDGTPRREFMCDVAFVGSWRAYAHAEHWTMRKAMLAALSRRYGRRFKCFPQRAAVRGRDLTDLYASVKVVVGDSCLAGLVPGYWSDRVPETMGRGGFLIHPYVLGMLNTHPDLVTFEPGNFDELINKVDHYLENSEAREGLRRTNAEYTRKHHTYLNRMQTVLETVGVV